MSQRGVGLVTKHYKCLRTYTSQASQHVVTCECDVCFSTVNNIVVVYCYHTYYITAVLGGESGKLGHKQELFYFYSLFQL